MNFFSKLFGGKKNQVTDSTNHSTTEDKFIDEPKIEGPTMELFIESEEPKKPKLNPSSQSKLLLFLNRDFHSVGIREGFEHHCSETLDNAKKKIRSEFQLIIDQQVQEMCDKKLQLQNLIVDVNAVSALTLKKLENTIADIDRSIDLLLKQKELSIENEGWIMNVLHSYNQGFKQGVDDYIAGEDFLNSIKNI